MPIPGNFDGAKKKAGCIGARRAPRCGLIRQGEGPVTPLSRAFTHPCAHRRGFGPASSPSSTTASVGGGASDGRRHYSNPGRARTRTCPKPRGPGVEEKRPPSLGGCGAEGTPGPGSHGASAVQKLYSSRNVAERTKERVFISEVERKMRGDIGDRNEAGPPTIKPGPLRCHAPLGLENGDSVGFALPSFAD
ncbi:hypothetical protein HPB50_018574 [Hyalomma asiaticum]|uniref:Uncharacterized protein n=1 Tax=Hyalomma asiaticum TaxID=266040 RepID=A0ACB7T3L5_HYAAI|nr:hypothetical protein HPB50_018574 [Hyalomma asiaticum]